MTDLPHRLRPENRSLSISITTTCNRTCPNCCCAIPTSVLSHIGVKELSLLALYFEGVPRLIITGGEPTLHPHFEGISWYIKQRFSPKEYVLATGAPPSILSPTKIEALREYDRIQVTRYSELSYAGSHSNLSVLQKLKKKLSGTGVRYDVPKVPLIHHAELPPEPRVPCGRWFTLAYHEGKLYPCCVAPGVPGGEGVDLSAGWLEKIRGLPYPCRNCLFAETGEG